MGARLVEHQTQEAEVRGERREHCSAAGEGDDVALKIYLYSRAQSVMGGTSQIQKNIIAQRILGLPTG